MQDRQDKTQTKRHIRLVGSSCLLGFVAALATACGDGRMAAQVPTPDSNILGPTSADATGRDFIDARGRRWIAVKKVVPREINVAETEKRIEDYRPAASPPPQRLTALALAEQLRPRRLVGGYEYRLEKPDLELAEKILAMKAPPYTKGYLSPKTIGPRFVVGSDDRARVGTPRFFPGSANAYLTQTCTATMIGPSTALSAAHCFYQNGWITSRSITFGADTVAPTAPYGSFLADSLTLPGAWNSNEWDWDFAVLEFSPTRFPGRDTSWFGTAQSFDGVRWIVGYPIDKPVPSSWIKGGAFTASPGSRYEHNIDIVPGDSGACAYDVNNRCTGIQSTQWRTTNPARVWNEVRRWDATTYNFFDAYANWP